jgi:hypothetical protein
MTVGSDHSIIQYGYFHNRAPPRVCKVLANQNASLERIDRFRELWLASALQTLGGALLWSACVALSRCTISKPFITTSLLQLQNENGWRLADGGMIGKNVQRARRIVKRSNVGADRLITPNIIRVQRATPSSTGTEMFVILWQQKHDQKSILKREYQIIWKEFLIRSSLIFFPINQLVPRNQLQARKVHFSSERVQAFSMKTLKIFQTSLIGFVHGASSELRIWNSSLKGNQCDITIKHGIKW